MISHFVHSKWYPIGAATAFFAVFCLALSPAGFSEKGKGKALNASPKKSKRAEMLFSGTDVLKVLVDQYLKGSETYPDYWKQAQECETALSALTYEQINDVVYAVYRSLLPSSRLSKHEKSAVFDLWKRCGSITFDRLFTDIQRLDRRSSLLPNADTSTARKDLAVLIKKYPLMYYQGLLTDQEIILPPEFTSGRLGISIRAMVQKLVEMELPEARAFAARLQNLDIPAINRRTAFQIVMDGINYTIEIPPENRIIAVCTDSFPVTHEDEKARAPFVCIGKDSQQITLVLISPDSSKTAKTGGRQMVAEIRLAQDGRWCFHKQTAGTSAVLNGREIPEEVYPELLSGDCLSVKIQNTYLQLIYTDTFTAMQHQIDLTESASLSKGPHVSAFIKPGDSVTDADTNRTGIINKIAGDDVSVLWLDIDAINPVQGTVSLQKIAEHKERFKVYRARDAIVYTNLEKLLRLAINFRDARTLDGKGETSHERMPFFVYVDQNGTIESISTHFNMNRASIRERLEDGSLEEFMFLLSYQDSKNNGCQFDYILSGSGPDLSSAQTQKLLSTITYASYLSSRIQVNAQSAANFFSVESELKHFLAQNPA